MHGLTLRQKERITNMLEERVFIVVLPIIMKIVPSSEFSEYETLLGL